MTKKTRPTQRTIDTPPPSLEARLDRLDDLRQQVAALIPAQVNDLLKHIAELEQGIKTECVQQQHEASGRALRVVLTAGRMTWDTRALEAYLLAKDLKEIVQQFKIVGQPSARIVAVKE